ERRVGRAERRRPADAHAAGAGVGRGAGVAVGAGCGVRRVHAARGRIARIVGADIGVVAVGGRPADADAAGAGVGRGAGVAVVARRQGGGTAATHAGAVTRGGGEAGGRARAGRSGRLEPASGRAAVAVQRVAVVALLPGIEEAVSADRGLLPEDGPEVRLDAAGRQPRPL